MARVLSVTTSLIIALAIAYAAMGQRGLLFGAMGMLAMLGGMAFLKVFKPK